MTIHLTQEQEQRIEEVLRRGAYDSIEEVVEAALAAIEQRTVPGFRGTPQQLDSLLAEGMASATLSEQEFWDVVTRETDAACSEKRDPSL